MLRIVALIVGAVLLSFGLSLWWGVDVYAAIALAGQALAKISWAGVTKFVSGFIIRFLTFEAPKRVLVWLAGACLISDDLRDHLVGQLRGVRDYLQTRWEKLNARFQKMGLGQQVATAIVLSVGFVVFATLAIGAWTIFWYVPSAAITAVRAIWRKLVNITLNQGFRRFLVRIWVWLSATRLGQAFRPAVDLHGRIEKKIREVGAPVQQKVAENLKRLLPKRTHGEKRPKARRYKRPTFVPPQPKAFQPENKECPNLNRFKAKQNHRVDFIGPRRH